MYISELLLFIVYIPGNHWYIMWNNTKKMRGKLLTTGTATLPLPLMCFLCLLLVLECHVLYPEPAGEFFFLRHPTASNCHSFPRQQRTAVSTAHLILLKSFPPFFFALWDKSLEIKLSFINTFSSKTKFQRHADCSFAGALNEKDVYQRLLSHVALTRLFFFFLF